jgi:Anti-sigma factor NepR
MRRAFCGGHQVTKKGQNATSAVDEAQGIKPPPDSTGQKDTAIMQGTTQAPDEPAAILDERIQTQIGQQLSSFYKELVNQPIPQNFIDLLAKLDRQEDGK